MLHKRGDGNGANETTPLFGTGPVSLQDPELPPAASDDEGPMGEEETIVSKISKASSTKSSDKSRKKVSAKDWHEDDPSTAASEVRVFKSPMKNFLLHFFHWFEAITILSCLGVLTTQILPIIIVPAHELGFLQIVLRSYVSLFSIIFILVELRVPFTFLKKSHILQTYFSRGFLYTFLGVVGMEEAYSGRIDDMVRAKEEFHVAWAPLFMQISSWFVFVIGCMYMIFGVCCLQIVRDNLDKQYRERVEEFKRFE
jgi:hypothetical protein